MKFTCSSYQAKHTISARMGFRAKRLGTNHHSQTSYSTLLGLHPTQPKIFMCDNFCRLFPDAGEENGSELSNKPAAPVHPFHRKMTIRRGILESECADVMQQFFQLRRRKKEKKEDSPPQPSCLPITNPQLKILGKMHGFFHSMFCL